jgi:predicted DsbA family dithiol-disulfide isomerase
VKRDWLLNVAVVVLTVCAVVVTGLLVRREFFPPAPKMPPPQRVAEWREFAREGHRTGPDDAKVTIVLFSDFQCPYCAVLAQSLHTVRERHPREVAVVYRHFPLATHPHAIAAARASECAAAQGRFEAFEDALFAARDSIGATPWSWFATRAAVRDTAAFRTCSESSAPVAALARDTVAGRRLEVASTPTFLVNEVRLVGAVPLDTLEAYVTRAIRQAGSGGSRGAGAGARGSRR